MLFTVSSRICRRIRHAGPGPAPDLPRAFDCAGDRVQRVVHQQNAGGVLQEDPNISSICLPGTMLVFHHKFYETIIQLSPPGLCYVGVPVAAGAVGGGRLPGPVLLGVGLRARSRWLPVHAEDAGHRADPRQVLLQGLGLHQECGITAGAVRGATVRLPERFFPPVWARRVLHLCGQCCHLGDYSVFRGPSGREEHEVFGEWVSFGSWVSFFNQYLIEQNLHEMCTNQRAQYPIKLVNRK